MSDFVRTRECCEIRGVPLEPTACTALNESNIFMVERENSWKQ
jgi:hypothetical protein